MTLGVGIISGNSALGDTTITIGAGQQFAGIQEAYLWAKNQIFKASAKLTINVSPGSYTYSQALDFTGFPSVKINGVTPASSQAIPSQNYTWGPGAPGIINAYSATLTLLDTNDFNIGDLVKIVPLVATNSLNAPEATACGVLKITAKTATTITIDQQMGNVSSLLPSYSGAIRSNTLAISRLNSILSPTAQLSLGRTGGILELSNIAFVEPPIAGGLYPTAPLLICVQSTLYLNNVCLVGGGIQTSSYTNLSMSGLKASGSLIYINSETNTDWLILARMGDYYGYELSNCTLSANSKSIINTSYGGGFYLSTILSTFCFNCINFISTYMSLSFFYGTLFWDTGNQPVFTDGNKFMVNDIYFQPSVGYAILSQSDFSDQPTQIRIRENTVLNFEGNQNASLVVTYPPIDAPMTVHQQSVRSTIA